MNDKIKVGVVGVGHLGRLHARLYKEVPDAQLVGLFDTNTEKTRSLAAELKVQAFDSLLDLILAVDAVNIVTPTTTHFEIAREALNHKKHLFIEKPITHDEKEAEMLIQLAEMQDRLIQVGHIERFNPSLLALEDVPLEPIFIEAHRLASFNPRGTDVAVILDLMIHDLDLVLHLVNSEPKHIAASGVGVISSSIDIANARIEFENGCVANITASRISSKKMRKMRLFQRDAYISMDFLDGYSEIFYLPDDQQSPFHDGTLALTLGQIDAGQQKRDIKYNRLERANVNPLQMELSTFIEAIRNGLEAPVSAREGLAALQLANRVIREIEAHQQLIRENLPQV